MLPIYIVLFLGWAAPSSGAQDYCPDGQCNDPHGGESGESMMQVKQKSSLQSHKPVATDGEGDEVVGEDQAAFFNRVRNKVMKVYGSEASVLENMGAQGLSGTLMARVDAILSSGNARDWEDGLGEYIEHACRILDTDKKVVAFGFLKNITAVAAVVMEMKQEAEEAFDTDAGVIEEMCIHKIYMQLILETKRGDHAAELSALLQQKPHLEAAFIQQTHGSREDLRLAPNRTQAETMTVAAVVYHFSLGSCKADEALFGVFGLGSNPLNYGIHCGLQGRGKGTGCSGETRDKGHFCKKDLDGGMDYACLWHDDNNHDWWSATGLLPKSLCFVDYAFQKRRKAVDSDKASKFWDANGVNALNYRDIANCAFDAWPCTYYDTKETCEFDWQRGTGIYYYVWYLATRCTTTTGWHEAFLLGHYEKEGSCGTKKCSDTRTCGGKKCCTGAMDCGLSQDGLR